MTVDEYAELLVHGRLQFVTDGTYQNKLGQLGYRAIYKNQSAYYWYSVSNTEVSIAPDEVGQAIITPERDVLRENPYFNSHSRQSFEATVRSGDHHFMLNAAPDPPRF
jgi:hypothetical protein